MEKRNLTEHPPRRFALIGLPGSGKSTFAVTLGRLLSIPVHPLDFRIFRNQQDADQYLASIGSQYV